MSDLKTLSLDFLICCYFGQSKDLVRAAIDRAYVDMASHTMISFKEEKTENKWDCRYRASKSIKNDLCNYPLDYNNYADWHNKAIDNIKGIYGEKINDGQAQKWLNMTVKYIFVFANILEEEQKELKLKEISGFIEKTCVSDYNMPIDSYVMKEEGLDKSFDPWSRLDDKQYEKLQENLKNDFMWELTNWESFKEKYKEIDRESYEAYYNKMTNK